jgi:hypothetical protein
VLPRCAGNSARSGRAAGAALTALARPTADAACPTLAARAAASASSAVPAGAVAAGRWIYSRTQVTEAADQPEDRACMSGGRHGQRG